MFTWNLLGLCWTFCKTKYKIIGWKWYGRKLPLTNLIAVFVSNNNKSNKTLSVSCFCIEMWTRNRWHTKKQCYHLIATFLWISSPEYVKPHTSQFWVLLLDYSVHVYWRQLRIMVPILEFSEQNPIKSASLLFSFKSTLCSLTLALTIFVF
jgi:hypothetical protein